MDKSENRFYREKQNPIMAYAGIRDGKIRSLVVDDTRDPEQASRLVSEWIRNGYTIERIDVETAVSRMEAERRADRLILPKNGT